MLTKKWMCVAVAVAALFVAAAAQAAAITVETFATDSLTTTWGLATNNPSADDILDASKSTWTGAGNTYTSDTGMAISPYPQDCSGGPSSNLNNGVGSAGQVVVPGNSWGTTVWLFDLGSVQQVTAFNTYTWGGDWAAERLDQHYTFYSSAADTAPSTEGDLVANGWTLVAAVDTWFYKTKEAYDTGGDPTQDWAGVGLQVGVSLTGSSGALTSARHLLMQVPDNYGGSNDFYSEVDVFVPEPATMGLLALGGLAVLRRRRARA